MGFPVFPLFWPYGETARGYREEGYYLKRSLTCWHFSLNPGTEQEIFTMDELIDYFLLREYINPDLALIPRRQAGLIITIFS